MARTIQRLPRDREQWEQDIRNGDAAADALLQAFAEREAFSGKPEHSRTALRGMFEQALQYTDMLCQPSRPKGYKSLLALTENIAQTPSVESERNIHGQRHYTKRQAAVDGIAKELLASAEALEAQATPRRLLNAWSADFSGMSNMDFELTMLTKDLPKTTDMIRVLAQSGAMESLAIAIDKRDQPYVARAAANLLGRFNSKGRDYNPHMIDMLTQLADSKLNPQTYKEVSREAKQWFSELAANNFSRFDTKVLMATYRDEMRDLDVDAIEQLHLEAPQVMLRLGFLRAADTLRKVHDFVYGEWHAVERLYPPEIQRDGKA